MAIPTTTALAPMLIQCLLLISFFYQGTVQASRFLCPNLPTARLGGQAGTACARGGSPPPRAPASRGRLSLHEQRGSTASKNPSFLHQRGICFTSRRGLHTHLFHNLSRNYITNKKYTQATSFSTSPNQSIYILLPQLLSIKKGSQAPP